MNLARMDDVAGCRLIFRNQQDLRSFRASFHKARFNHTRRYSKDPDKYDYIKSPKETGYRGIHDVYEYDVNSNVGKPLTGLYVEIQYRTLVQHAWATAVEVIGFITESQPKFQKGDKRYEHAMSLASEVLARAYEGQKGPHPELSDRAVVARFLAAEKEIRLIETLRSLNAAHRDVSTNRNAILIFSGGKPLEVRTYRDATEALRELFTLEKELPDRDIVLVRADTSDQIRLAFRNYFSDARDFIRLVEGGCSRLAGPSERSHGQRSRRRSHS
jgi:putative GTP pyrophosphokinase